MEVPARLDSVEVGLTFSGEQVARAITAFGLAPNRREWGIHFCEDVSPLIELRYEDHAFAAKHHVRGHDRDPPLDRQLLRGIESADAGSASRLHREHRSYPVNLAERIAAGDTSLFHHVESQTSEGDRVSLLALHDTIARELGQFTYLEIGSHLGGTLQVFVADARCSAIVSVDPRPPSQPDDRGPVFHYDGNSTERMLGLLEAVPGADLGKLLTIERGTEDIGPWEVERPDLAFIDGEHTHGAALRDARFCRELMSTGGVIAFHDSGIIGPAIHEFVAETTPAAAFPVRDGLYLVELGTVPHILGSPAVAARACPTTPE